MLKKYMGIAGLLLLLFSACSKDEIMQYDTNTHWLYVPTFSLDEEIGTQDQRRDTMEMSFQHYLNITELEVQMPVCLIGPYLTEDKTFQIEIDEEETTAEPGDYTVDLEQVFHAGVLEDYVHVTLHKTPHLENDKVVLQLRLVANENFGIAEYIGEWGQNTYTPLESTTIRIVFSDIISRPDWWDENMVGFYIGDYSDEKYRRFIESSGRTNFDGCSSTDIRKILLKFKEDILANGWTEADGSEMIIPIN